MSEERTVYKITFDLDVFKRRLEQQRVIEFSDVEFLLDELATRYGQLRAAETERDQAIADNAGLLIVLRELDYSNPDQAQRLLDQVRDGDHAGRELMAHLTRRFGAAERLADAARLLRDHLERSNKITDARYYDALCDLLDEYEAVKAGA